MFADDYCMVYFLSTVNSVVCMSLTTMFLVFFFKQKTAYEMRISDWSSDVCSSDLSAGGFNDEDVTGLHVGRTCGPQFRLAAIDTLHISTSRLARSEERRVGKECVSTCRSRWSPYH